MGFPLLRWVLFWLCTLLPAVLYAQDGKDGSSTRGPVIRAIEINRQTIFDSSEARNWPMRLVNKLHVLTRIGVVRRELLFRQGDPYDSLRATETARNLRRLGVFRRVLLDTATTDSGLMARVTTKDGWTTRADFRFKSTGGQVDYQLAFLEDNLLGTATKASAKYRKTPDRSSVLFQVRQPRLAGRPLALGLFFEDRSDGTRASFALEQPFYSMLTRAGGQFFAELRNERILRFFNGEEVASDTVERRYTLSRFEGAKALRADDGGYLRLGFSLQVQRDDYAAEASGPFGKTVAASAGSFLEWRRARFLVTRGFVGFGREEDVDLSTTVRLGLAAAPKGLGYQRDGIGPLVAVHTGFRFRPGFFFIDGKANGVYTSAGLDSGSVTLSSTLAVVPARGHQLMLHADGGWLKAPLPGTEFDLGLYSGPRAFRAHAFTGDRSFFATAEYRVMVAEDVLRLAGVGFAAFGDYGGAWYSGSRKRLGTNVGVGLRLVTTRTASFSPTRLDLVYRVRNEVEPGGWVLVVAKGLVFSTPLR